eukprot:PLAT8553.1.p1 GENE.PLAT8553.1~~PLAT8553.1.p1  ORF type:complete len:251 (-),score=98.49 PLAT8553.1:406-1122(-)
MPILYGAVAVGRTILADHTEHRGNFREIARKLFAHIESSAEARMSFQAEEHSYHYLRHSDVLFLAMTDSGMRRRPAFSFLDSVRDLFFEQFGERGKLAKELALVGSFGPVLRRQMLDYSKELDKIGEVRKELDDLKSIAQESVFKVLERGDRLDVLMDKAEGLSSTAVEFRSSSTKLRQRMQLNRLKMTLVLIIIGLAILYIFISAVCGGPSLVGCRDGGDDGSEAADDGSGGGGSDE